MSDELFEATFEEIKLSGNLPTPAGVGMRILELTREEDFSTEDIAAAILSDSSLTGRILMLANAAGHASRERASTIQGAIVRLGSRAVRDMALAFSLVSDRSAQHCAGFDYDRYWARSLARAVVSQLLSGDLAVGKPEEAYIAGLLADIGQLALASTYPEPYARILASDAARHPRQLLLVEREEFRINHSEIGRCMILDWGLPASFAEGIKAFTDDRQCRDRVEGLTAILRLADMVAEVLIAGPDDSEEVWTARGRGFEFLAEALGKQPGELTDFLARCVAEWKSWGSTLEIEVDPAWEAGPILSRIEVGQRATLDTGAAPPAATLASAPTSRLLVGGEMPAPERQVRVLIIERDPASSQAVRAGVGKGYEILAASDGKAGLRMALKTPPDIVVCAQDTPDLSGLELCKALRRTEAGMRMYLILLSDDLDEDLTVEAFDAGIDDVVSKPIITRLLAARVKGGVRLAELSRKIQQDKQTMMRQVTELGMLTRKLRSAALTDPLTELPNRRYAMKRLEAEWSSGDTTGRPLSLAMVDIDHFKRVNDEHGHDVGDAVLREVSARLRESLRQSDEICRVGGEEFLIVCKNTSQRECAIVAERVRRAVEALEIASIGRPVTVSIGVAGRHSGVAGLTELLKAADEAVYRAKDGGRNQVCSAPPPPSRLRRA